MSNFFLLASSLTDFFAQASQTPESGLNGSVILGKGIYLFTAAIFGFIFNIFLDIYKKTSEQKRQLTYNIDYGETARIIKIYEQTKEEIESTQISVNFSLKNSGKRDLKEQFIRLMTSQGTKISSAILQPNPEREMNFKISDLDLKQNEIAYDIGYMKPEQRIEIQIVIENPNNTYVELKPFHKSNTEEVLFEPQENIKIRSDREILQKFIALCLFFIIVPIPFDLPIRISVLQSVYLLQSDLGLEFNLASVIRMSLIPFLALEIEPFSQVVTNIVNEKLKQ